MYTSESPWDTVRDSVPDVHIAAQYVDRRAVFWDLERGFEEFFHVYLVAACGVVHR